MAIQQCMFFKKNRADFELSQVVITPSVVADMAANLNDRNVNTAWNSGDSSDASMPTIIVDMGDVRNFNRILLLKHNFKSYTIQYYNEDTLAYANFSTPINETTNTLESTIHSFTLVSSSKVKLTINGTMTPDAAKYLYEFIVTEFIGQFSGWPIIKKPTLSKALQKRQMLSGKTHILQNVGAYSASLGFKVLSSDADMTIIESLYDSSEGFLFWPCGGNEDQFKSVRQGYRKEDIYLVRCANEFMPEWYNGYQNGGMVINMDLVEVVT